MPETSDTLPPPRCWAEIDLPALAHNAEVCKELAGCKLMAIVKADAYGHGLEEVARTLLGKVAFFGVANVREALRIREALRESSPQILILSPATPDEVGAIVSHEFAASVSSEKEVEIFSEMAQRLETKAFLHAVADTGMGRMGSPVSEFPALVSKIVEDPYCSLDGVDTHFPSADEDTSFTRSQIATFESILHSLALPEGVHVHLANSAGIIGYSDEMPFATVVRPGLALYGISPLEQPSADLLPTLAWKSRIGLVRDIPAGTSISYGRTFIAEKPMTVATLGVGYGDGYPRHLTGKGAPVLISGQRCPIVGRVTMDQIVVDVSDLGERVSPGDEAVLIGEQRGERILAEEIADLAETIPWEILTGITGRVERVYL